MFEVGLSGQMFDDLSIWDHLRAAHDFGYRSVELRSTHVTPETSEEELDTIRSFLREKDLPVNCLSCFTGNYGLLDDAGCESAFLVFQEYVQLARFFDSDMVRVWPAWQESSAAPEEVWEKAAHWVRRSADHAAQFGKRLVMEMHHGTLCDSAQSSLRLLERIGRENVGVTLDPVNLYQVPADYGPDAVGCLGQNVFNVHVKDIVQLKTSDYPYAFAYSGYVRHIGRFTKVVPPTSKAERYYCHRRINQGGIDWSCVLNGLREIGYQGHLIVESVSETNKHLPSGRDLARICYKDVMAVQGRGLPQQPLEAQA